MEKLFPLVATYIHSRGVRKIEKSKDDKMTNGVKNKQVEHWRRKFVRHVEGKKAF